MSTGNRLDLFLKEVTDEYVRDNFWRLKNYLDNLNLSSGGTTTIITGGTTGSSSPWVSGSRTLASGTTTVVDSLPLSSLDCLVYHVCFREQGGTKSKTLKVDVRKDGAGVEDQISAKSGNVDVLVNVIVDGSNVVLQMVNEEPVSVDVNFVRLFL